jgi:CRP-like cAMP-binding protein
LLSPGTSAIELYVAKLERRRPLSRAARESFLHLPIQVRSHEANYDILREGEEPTHSCLVGSGLVSRFKTLRNGSRQIVSFHLPGDMVDLQSSLLLTADCGFRSHTPVQIGRVAHRDVLQLAAEFPEIGRALWFDTLIDAAIFREWTVNVGRRNSREATAHLLLEFAWRYERCGELDGDSFELPVSQSDLSDALGISPVHLNRTLQWLRSERLISTHSRTVVLQNRPALTRLAGFDPTYLDPGGPRMVEVRV